MIILLAFSFFSTFSLALFLVPILSKQAVLHGYVDKPNARKVHSWPTPRIGGVAVFISFYTTLALLAVFFPALLERHILDPKSVFLILGSLVAFGVGLADDFKGLRARHKLYVQLVAAGLAYCGGIHIESIGFYDLFQLELGWFSPVVSIFWMVLVINAFNLIDGLDGLAGGVGIIACAILGYACMIRGNVTGMVFMVAIAGGLLGFLRYNFFPASVFMGDGGSYFLGYLLATTSILCSMGNNATMTTLIPLLAVALPIIDVTMSTLRRFVHGQGIFSPDKRHFHHMLLRRGLSHRGAVLVLYAVTLFISCCALLFIEIRDDKAFLLLMLLGLCVLFGIVKLGYFRHYDMKALVPWLSGIGDEVGLTRDRRSFFDIQVKIGSSRTFAELGTHLEKAMEMLGFMTCALYLQQARRRKKWHFPVKAVARDERRITPALHATVAMRQSPPEWLWCNPYEEMDQHSRSLFRVEMDLQNDDGMTFGTLLLVKNQAVSPVTHYTLKRVEHLKRSIVKALAGIEQATSQVDASYETVLPVSALAALEISEKEAFEKLKN
ncbi:MAG: undecaprenyl/decaprenyl-phosphate alpha-N-acetylglucosaminyl 1-phosphate transferase [Chlorobium sp.]|nr:undecaprenyl/decaprenyl-phosphate alpha-N-acetylglucosaminyl 1-phosphate transferase [Chlorobium sp.]